MKIAASVYSVSKMKISPKTNCIFTHHGSSEADSGQIPSEQHFGDHPPKNQKPVIRGPR